MVTGLPGSGQEGLGFVPVTFDLTAISLPYARRTAASRKANAIASVAILAFTDFAGFVLFMFGLFIAAPWSVHQFVGVGFGVVTVVITTLGLRVARALYSEAPPLEVEVAGDRIEFKPSKGKRTRFDLTNGRMSFQIFDFRDSRDGNREGTPCLFQRRPFTAALTAEASSAILEAAGRRGFHITSKTLPVTSFSGKNLGLGRMWTVNGPKTTWWTRSW